MALNLDILNLESFLFLKTVREEMALRRNVCLLSQEERIRAVKTDVIRGLLEVKKKNL